MSPRDRRNWVAIELDFPDNPKILGVGALGGWAHLRAIIYCARHRTDGFIPKAAVWQILHDDPDMDEAHSEIEASMVEAGLWVLEANGYRVHDYLEHQTSAETMREKRARAGRIGGLASAKQRQAKAKQSKLEVEVEKDLTPTPQPSTYNGAPVENLPDLDNILKDMPL